MAKLTVYLDRPVYSPGDEVKGEAILEIAKPLTVRAITVIVDGKERICFKDPDLTGHPLLYLADNPLLQLNITVATPGELQPGEHRFPFSFLLPPNAPADYRGPNASVGYLIIAKADITMGFDAFQCPNLNVAIPRSLCSLDTSPKTFATATADDPTKPGLVAQIPRSGYFCGDVVEGTIQLTGDGGHRVRKARVVLKTLENATAEGRCKESIDIVSKVDISGEMLIVGMAVPFRIEIPKDSPGTYTGRYFSMKWFMEIDLDMALANDISASQWIDVYNAV